MAARMGERWDWVRASRVGWSDRNGRRSGRVR